MTHSRLQDGIPSGIILAKNPLTSSLDELKIYNENTIYLNDGNEFQIRLFNPLRERIGAQINFNGESSSSYLVLNPGEDATIDRFVDTQKKMLFETYQYDSNNSLAENAVAKNGIVSIKFFKEKKNVVYFSSNFSGVLNSTGGTYKNPVIYRGSDLSTGTLNLHDTNVFNTTSLNNTTTISSNTLNCINTSSVSMDNLEFNSDKEVINTKSYQPKTRMKETGRVGKGGQSTQNFKKIDVEFEYYSFYEITYNLKPISEKSEDIEIREYCTQCSTRIRKKTWIYCPKCGNKLN